MPTIEITKETHQKLLALKNHWTITYRQITNQRALDKIEKLKEEIFGYTSTATAEEIQQISNTKTRSQLETESEKFQRELQKIARSGIDLEAEYTMNEHLKKMAEVIDENTEIGTPLF
ncbi:MAG TPA: hypothetical protein ENH13_01025 [Euryarchaeota archaeon]|nr:hypothetical protein BMS3Bbin16_00063 [archaeon BMS3Bbin16]HDH27694.1 hypothetical protein [Euryarchaeota archaeon]